AFSKSLARFIVAFLVSTQGGGRLESIFVKRILKAAGTMVYAEPAASSKLHNGRKLRVASSGRARPNVPPGALKPQGGANHAEVRTSRVLAAGSRMVRHVAQREGGVRRGHPRKRGDAGKARCKAPWCVPVPGDVRLGRDGVLGLPQHRDGGGGRRRLRKPPLV